MRSVCFVPRKSPCGVNMCFTFVCFWLYITIIIILSIFSRVFSANPSESLTVVWSDHRLKTASSLTLWVAFRFLSFTCSPWETFCYRFITKNFQFARGECWSYLFQASIFSWAKYYPIIFEISIETHIHPTRLSSSLFCLNHNLVWMCCVPSFQLYSSNKSKNRDFPPLFTSFWWFVFLFVW